MAVRACYSTDASAPRLSGTAGDFVNLLRKCLIDGYGSKTPPGGWACHASGNGQKLALHSTAPGATGLWLHVDDSGSPNPQSAYCRGWESLTGLDANGDPVDGVAQFPTSTQQATYAAKKSQSSDTVSRPWVLIADEFSFYVFVDPASNATFYGTFPFFFGDLVSLRQGDAYHCLAAFGGYATVGGASASHSSEIERIYTGSGFALNQTGHWIARRYDQTGAAIQVGKIGDPQSVSSGVMGAGTGFPYPNPADGSLMLCPVSVFEPSSCLRGQMPGLYQPMHARPLAHLATVADPVGLPGRTLQALYTYYSTPGEVLLDLTGPWR